MKKAKILTFSGYYLPGYKGGGPVRTIENMVTQLEDDIEFWIITRDRDLGDTAPYPFIESNKWQKVGAAHVYYLSPNSMNLKNIAELLKGTCHDIVYLNSFFDTTFTIFVLLARFFFKSSLKPIVLAPRGEFSKAALSIKKTKKNIYLSFFKIILSKKIRILLQASSEYEFNDIKNALKTSDASIRIAKDLPRKENQSRDFFLSSRLAETESLRVIFLSRISPMKNLDFAIQVLKEVKSKVFFDIYGPKEDLSYWARCETLITQLPNNIVTNYCGSIPPEQVKEKFSRYDLFLFPTRGENYGHVIAESISAGTPVLLSDRTPWRDLEELGAGWVLPLDSHIIFSQKIDALAELSLEQRQEKRSKILQSSEKNLCDPDSIQQNRELFLSLVRA
ncbi:glycosyltransferase family 4 protein [Pseudomonas sp. NFXW11]|uniref:glycosyltransferase family 4 protein n=1 Tax=Pseudomonas sp. NFXW11 TaxID=2819531 RepID=UPI003CF41790